MDNGRHRKRTSVWLGEQCIPYKNCPPMTTTIYQGGETWVTVTVTTPEVITKTKHTRSMSTITVAESSYSSSHHWTPINTFSTSSSSSYSISSSTSTSSSVLSSSTTSFPSSVSSTSLPTIIPISTQSPTPSSSNSSTGGIGLTPRKTPVALIASIVSVALVLLILALLTFFLLRRRQRNEADNRAKSITPLPQSESVFSYPTRQAFSLRAIWPWKQESVEEIKPREEDEKVLLQNPQQPYTPRQQPTGSTSSRLDQKVARFFTPEIHDMLQQVPEGRGNQVSVRVSLGNRPRTSFTSSSSPSFRSFRWNRL